MPAAGMRFADYLYRKSAAQANAEGAIDATRLGPFLLVVAFATQLPVRKGGMTMTSLRLTPEQFAHILRCCQGVLIDEGTAALDLKHFLVSRLSDTLPDIATRLIWCDEAQLQSLRQKIILSLRGQEQLLAQ